MSEQPVYLPSARRPHPGRPRKADPGHIVGTSAAQRTGNTGPNGSALAQQAIAPIGPRRPWPRVLDLQESADYLSVSVRVVWGWWHAGILQRVRPPDLNGGELRKVLFDREDLDRLIERWKDQT